MERGGRQTFMATIGSIPFEGHLGLLLLALVLAFLARGSLQTTIAFLRHITGGSKLSIIVLHAFLQVAVILIGFVLAMAEFHVIAEPWMYHPGLWPGSMIWATLARIPELLNDLPSRSHDYFLFVGSLTMTCVFPTLAYLTVLAVMCLIWPRLSWLIVRRLVFNITSNKPPVLDQLGYFCGGVAAAIPLVAGLIPLVARLIKH
jgi:hypothetical protein